MIKLSVLLDYHNFNKKDFNIFLSDVNNGIYGHVIEFDKPPVSKVGYELLVKNYRDNNYSFESGGHIFKGVLDISRTAMICGLDSLREYVEILPGINIDLVNLSGFHIYKQSITSSVVPVQPILKNFTRPGGAVLSFEFLPVEGAEYYGAYLVEGGALPEGYTFINGVLDIPAGNNPRILHNCLKSKLKIFSALKLKTEYTVYGYCGNSAGVSILSDGTSAICSNK